jgi:hypothetical protein
MARRVLSRLRDKVQSTSAPSIAIRSPRVGTLVLGPSGTSFADTTLISMLDTSGMRVTS